jgi:hypothetical protein
VGEGRRVSGTIVPDGDRDVAHSDEAVSRGEGGIDRRSIGLNAEALSGTNSSPVAVPFSGGSGLCDSS